MAILFVADPRFEAHDTGPHHPERPARLRAVAAAVERSGVPDALTVVAPEPADAVAINRVHPAAYVEALDDFVAKGGGHLDPDTVAGPDSMVAARLAAGAGLQAVRALDAKEADTAFLAVRPPGHHATPRRPMGFCLLNNIAITATALADRGERVLIVDFDAHHGNGTQDAFYGDGRVAYVSMHQYPFYPGTGALDESGAGDGAGTTMNVPLPAGTTGDVYRRVVDELVVPMAEAFAPTWLLLSADYDAHRADPLTDLGLTAADFADLTTALVPIVPVGRTIFFLEGGYDLEALTSSVASTLAVLAGSATRPKRADGSTEPTTSGGPGQSVVDAVRAHRQRHGWA